MQSQPHDSSRSPAEWSGATLLIQKWLARRCAGESVADLAGGILFLVFGLIALAVTSCIMAAIVLFVVIEVSVFISLMGLHVEPLRPFLFVCFFLAFMGLSIVHAYKTRWGTEAAAQLDFGTAFSSTTSISWEFISAGPILLILAGQDFHRYVRLRRLDIPHVSALLLWLYDKNNRAGFTEISIAFPALNAVRVLPQLRDLTGVNWWPEQGEVSFSDSLRRDFENILGRAPKSAHFGNYRQERPHFKKPVIEIDQEIQSWYAAMNLPLYATLQEVKTRYRKLAKIHHPDMRAANRRPGEPSSDEQMKRINEAYHNLLKHSQRHAGNSD